MVVEPNPYLSIAIPTYNRPIELAECLESILPQAEKLGVRIYISDNGSTSDVESVLRRFRERYPYIFFRRNEKNLGINGNIRPLMDMAEGEYVWLFSDDDVITDGALANLIEQCQLGDYDLIIPDREYRDRNLKIYAGTYRVNNVRVATTYTDPLELLERYGYSCYTFVGCLVIRLAAWRRVDASQYTHCQWFEFTCVIAEMMLQGTALVLADCSVLVRGENATWSPHRWKVWGYHFPVALVALATHYPLESLHKVLGEMVNPRVSNPLRFIMTGRALNYINWNNCNEVLDPYFRLRSYAWIFLFGVALTIPVPLARLLKQRYGITSI